MKEVIALMCGSSTQLRLMLQRARMELSELHSLLVTSGLRIGHPGAASSSEKQLSWPNETKVLAGQQIVFNTINQRA